MQRNTRLQLSFVLATVGGGLLIYGALKSQQLPHYSDDDIATSIELNLSLDLARLGNEHTQSPQQIETMRKSIRAEIDTEIAHDRDAVQTWFVAGAVLVVMALAQFLTQRYLMRRSVPGQLP